MTISELAILLGKLKPLIGDDAQVFIEFPNDKGGVYEMDLDDWTVRPGVLVIRG